MRKDVDIVILQKPIEVVFTCPYCENEVSVGYDEFENITGNDLGDILYDSTLFNYPKCNGALETDGVELDLLR